MQLLHLGDLELTLPLAAATLAWLLAARAWRAASAWALLYGGAIALVGGSKIAYLAWGADIALLGFKAFSGHATGVTAVYPVLGYLLCRPAGRNWGLAAAGAGLVLGVGLVFGLVRQDEHALAEAASGWLLGACASIGTLYQAEFASARQTGYQNQFQPGFQTELEAKLHSAYRSGPQTGFPAEDQAGGPSGPGVAHRKGPPGVAGGPASAFCAIAVFVASAFLMQSAHVGYWMIKVALALSGNARPFSWDTCG